MSLAPGLITFLVLAHPGSLGHSPGGCEMVVVVVVVVVAFSDASLFVPVQLSFVQSACHTFHV